MSASAAKQLQTQRVPSRGNGTIRKPPKLLESSLDCIFIVDNQWRFRHVNSKAAQEFGIGEDLIGRCLWATFPESVGSSFDRHYRQALENRQQTVFEAYYAPLDSWYEIQASPLPAGGLICCFRNINERHFAERALRQAEERERGASRNLLQCVIDSVSDLIFVKGLDGRFVLTNRALDEGCGSLVGRSTEDVFAGELSCGYESVDRAVVESAGQVIVEEVIPVGGERRVFETVKVPWIQDGRISGIIGVSRDITAAKQAQLALQHSEALTRSMIDASADSIMLVSLEGAVQLMNAAAKEAFGAHVPDSPTWETLWSEAAGRPARRALRRAMRGTPARFTASSDDGTARWWDVVLSPVRSDHDAVVKLVGIARDVTQQRLTEEKVRWTASHDPLTELPNRVLFQQRLAQAIQNAASCGQQVGLLQLDVDHFKQVNDSLGHDAGDALLRTFAERLRRVVRQSDTVARLGGDEFSVVLPALPNSEDVTRIAQSFLERLKEPFCHEGHLVDCRASIGAAVFPQDGSTADELLKSADTALYMAKAGGRGNLMKFDPTMRAELQKRSSMIGMARHAVRTNQIIPFYQPKVDLSSGRIGGFEALLRWRSDRHGIQAPGTIAAAFEDSEVARAISETIVRTAVEDMRSWMEAGLDFGHVAINAAAAEFRFDDLGERVLQELARAGVPNHLLQLEVTESVFLGRGAEYVERALKLLSASGVTIALDDFGTGYASLRHLKDFPVDVLKIDQSFVRDLDRDEGDAAIVAAVVRLGQSLGMATVAEGVETREQARCLLELGCGEAQGHLYSPAICGSRVPSLIRNWKGPKAGTSEDTVRLNANSYVRASKMPPSEKCREHRRSNQERPCVEVCWTGSPKVALEPEG